MDECTDLENISGLKVIHCEKQGIHYYRFMHGKRTLRIMCTYEKAHAFAEGVAIGIDLGASNPYC